MSYCAHIEYRVVVSVSSGALLVNFGSSTCPFFIKMLLRRVFSPIQLIDGMISHHAFASLLFIIQWPDSNHL
jgi:hypothetical protein